MPSIYSATSGNTSTSYINRNERAHNSALGHVASGKKINKASDDAAGLAVATQLMSDVSTLRQSSTNLLQGTSVLQTADGALEQAGNMLNRMKELATQANSGALDANSRSAINDEYQNLAAELNNLSTQTNFNGQNLLDGSYNQTFQAGTDATNTLSADLSSVDISTTGLGLTPAAGGSATALLTPASAAATSAELDTAIQNLSSYRSDLGSALQAFTTRNDVVDNEINSTIEAQSAISDADLAKEQTDLVNSKALMELSIAAAAQGNRMSSALLGLVRQG